MKSFFNCLVLKEKVSLQQTVLPCRRVPTCLCGLEWMQYDYTKVCLIWRGSLGRWEDWTKEKSCIQILLPYGGSVTFWAHHQRCWQSCQRDPYSDLTSRHLCWTTAGTVCQSMHCQHGAQSSPRTTLGVCVLFCTRHHCNIGFLILVKPGVYYLYVLVHHASGWYPHDTTVSVGLMWNWFQAQSSFTRRNQYAKLATLHGACSYYTHKTLS